MHRHTFFLCVQGSGHGPLSVKKEPHFSIIVHTAQPLSSSFFPQHILSPPPLPFFSLFMSILLSQFCYAWQCLIKFTGVISFDDSSSSAFSAQIAWRFWFMFILHFHSIQSLVNFSHCLLGSLCFSSLLWLSNYWINLPLKLSKTIQHVLLVE